MRFAFEYDYKTILQDLDWFASFELFVTTHILPPEARKAFKSIYLYEWMVGTGDTELVRAHPEWFLGEERGRWYYDLHQPALRAWRALQLAKRLDDIGYSGLFLDCLGTFDHEGHEELQREHRKRYKTPYSHGVRAQLAAFQKAGIRIFTNQAYRNPLYQEQTRADLTESLLFNRRGAQDPRVLEPLPPATRYHLCYCRARRESGRLLPNREAIYYTLAAARLYGHDAYIQNLDRREEPELNHDPLYHVQLGKPTHPLTESYGILRREYTRGVVLLNRGAPERVPLKGTYYDPYTQKEVRDAYDMPSMTGRILLNARLL